MSKPTTAQATETHRCPHPLVWQVRKIVQEEFSRSKPPPSPPRKEPEPAPEPSKVFKAAPKDLQGRQDKLNLRFSTLPHYVIKPGEGAQFAQQKRFAGNGEGG
eukprot:6476826-Amphidinium_carterae.2